MSLEFFEHFIRTEVSRHPILSAALQSKSNLRKCSQQFEHAVTDLHYRLIKAAVQNLFSKVSSARVQELSSVASTTCETKYVVTESSPNTQTSQATDNENFSLRGRKPAQHSPPRSQQIIRGQQKNNDQCGGGGGVGGGGGSSQWVKAEDAHHHSHQAPRQQRHECQQPQQHHFCPQEQPQRPASCAKPPQPESVCLTAPLTHRPPRPQPTTREGPACSYPTAGHHNRRAMSGWYVANMDALLSNLMRLFEMIYRDTLQLCGVGARDLQHLRNALPDPTLISMQQRASGAWRPNFMNCKIDFLLHIAAIVYRNTQDIRCGCACSMPTDPCAPSGADARRHDLPPPSVAHTCATPPAHPAAGGCGAGGCGAGWTTSPRGVVEVNRNNHTACDCHCQEGISSSQATNSPLPQGFDERWVGADYTNASSSSGGRRKRRCRRRRRHRLKPIANVLRARATIFSTTSRTSSRDSCDSRSSSGSNSGSSSDDTGKTCLSVEINAPQ